MAAGRTGCGSTAQRAPASCRPRGAPPSGLAIVSLRDALDISAAPGNSASACAWPLPARRWRTPFTRPAWNAASPSPRTLSGHSSGSGRASRSRSGSRRCRPLLGDPPPSPRAIRPHAVPYVGATCPSPVWWPHRYLRPRDRRKAHTGHNETVPRRSGRHLPSSPFKPPPGDPPARQYANWVIS
jgi:hypothetical protein